MVNHRQLSSRARAREWSCCVADPSAAPGADLALVAAQIERIMALADAARFHEGREACADLVFDFQPLIVARPELFHRVVAALRRCDGHQLLARLAIAAHGDTG